MKILLFDIDGTLILSGGAGDRSLTKAFERLYGLQKAMEGIKPAGKTDPAIVREIFVRKLNIEPTDEQIKEVLDVYAECLVDEVRNSKGYRVLPGVHELLEKLDGDQDFLLGLATGNIERGARIKLSRADLWRYFSFGGFGSDSEERDVIVRMAVERGLKLADYDPELVAVIGDTPRDIKAAHDAGVFAVGVATGPYSVDELYDSGAEIAFEDLSDLGDFYEKIETLSEKWQKTRS